MLDNASAFADLILVLDDKSDDGGKTESLCRSYPKVKFFTSQYEQSMFGIDESKLRNTQWEMTKSFAKDGDWIISQDADETFSDSFIKELPELIKTTEYDWYSVRLLDMWNETEYRTDGYWSPLITRLFRYQDKPFGYAGNIHCGCVPSYVSQSMRGMARSDLFLNHWGWADDKDKERKYEFYLQRATGINLEHAHSIFKPAQLKPFRNEIEWPNIVVASLVRNREWVIDKFLAGMDLLDYPKEKLSFYFIVNDSQDGTFEILKKWAESKDKVYKLVEIETINFGNASDKEHSWEDQKLANMAFMRNRVLGSLDRFQSEAVFMVDSDIVMKHPRLLKHLVGLERPIVSEVFWATWGHKDAQPLPNVWIRGGYEINAEFLSMLKRPGTYPVGGLGACTLIGREPISRGVGYSRVQNLPSNVRGEDRDFCVRAMCAGYKLWADTYFTPDHLEKPENLVESPEVKAKRAEEEEKRLADEITKFKDWRSKLPRYNQISLSIMAKNEEKNIAQAIQSALPIVDEVVVCDTGSTDKTIEIAKSLGARVVEFPWDIPSKGFSEPRNAAIRACTKPWILRLDADEIVPKDHLLNVWKLAQVENVDAYLVPIRNYQANPFENGWDANWVLSETLRMFVNDPRIFYTRLVHEDIDDSLAEMGKSRKVNIVRTQVPLYHFGYLKEKHSLTAKHDWYYALAERQCELTPKDPRPYFIRAIHLYHNKKYDEAFVLYQKTVELDPKLWGAWNDIGVILFNKGKYVEAKDAFVKAKEAISSNSHSSHVKKIEDNLKATDAMLQKIQQQKLEPAGVA
jgi:glycosyltransferase involved in cell wall biosynthesis